MYTVPYVKEKSLKLWKLQAPWWAWVLGALERHLSTSRSQYEKHDSTPGGAALSHLCFHRIFYCFVQVHEHSIESNSFIRFMKSICLTCVPLPFSTHQIQWLLIHTVSLLLNLHFPSLFWRLTIYSFSIFVSVYILSMHISKPNQDNSIFLSAFFSVNIVFLEFVIAS